VKRIGTPPCIALFSAAAFGCSGAPLSSSDATARTEAVQAALAKPTGTVSPAMASALLHHWQSFQRVQAAFESILSIGSESGVPCLSGSADAGAYDLSCLTAGRVRGRLTFESHASMTDAGPSGRLDAHLEDACVVDACVNGEALVDIVPGDCVALATLAVTATVSRDGETGSLSFGAQGGMARGTLLPHVVYFDADGLSLVVDGAGGLGMPGPYLVSGANRSFECLFLANGGQCDGASAFTF
jgi:hypothetical protein